jgi:hypothetical protein
VNAALTASLAAAASAAKCPSAAGMERVGGYEEQRHASMGNFRLTLPPKLRSAPDQVGHPSDRVGLRREIAGHVREENRTIDQVRDPAAGRSGAWTTKRSAGSGSCRAPEQ